MVLKKTANLLRGVTAIQQRILLSLVPCLCDLIRAEGRSECFLRTPEGADVLEAGKFLLSHAATSRTATSADLGGIPVKAIFDIYSSRPVELWAGLLKAVMCDQSKTRGWFFPPEMQTALLGCASALALAQTGSDVAILLSPILGDMPHSRYLSLSAFCALVRDTTECPQLAHTLARKMFLKRKTGAEAVTMKDVNEASMRRTLRRRAFALLL